MQMYYNVYNILRFVEVDVIFYTFETMSPPVHRNLMATFLDEAVSFEEENLGKDDIPVRCSTEPRVN